MAVSIPFRGTKKGDSVKTFEEWWKEVMWYIGEVGADACGDRDWALKRRKYRASVVWHEAWKVVSEKAKQAESAEEFLAWCKDLPFSLSF